MDKKFLEDSIKTYLQSGEKDKLFACRMALSAVQKRESAKELTNEQILEIVKKESTELEEAALYNKTESVKYISASNFLKSLLPEQVKLSEYDGIIQKALNELSTQTPKMGEIISALKKKFGTTLDYKIVSQKLKEKL